MDKLCSPIMVETHVPKAQWKRNLDCIIIRIFFIHTIFFTGLSVNNYTFVRLFSSTQLCKILRMCVIMGDDLCVLIKCTHIPIRTIVFCVCFDSIFRLDVEHFVRWAIFSGKCTKSIN